MKKIASSLFVLFILLLNGCDNSGQSISEEQAKTIVIEQHTGNYGEVIITSVSYKNDEYIIEWENKENCESGTDYIDGENGEIKRGENTIC